MKIAANKPKEDRFEAVKAFYDLADKLVRGDDPGSIETMFAKWARFWGDPAFASDLSLASRFRRDSGFGFVKPNVTRFPPVDWRKVDSKGKPWKAGASGKAWIGERGPYKLRIEHVKDPIEKVVFVGSIDGDVLCREKHLNDAQTCLAVVALERLKAQEA